jgi:hypothetical protein
MALLTQNALLDCLYIPDFIPAGSKMLFENASAPTSWTKDTSYNNATLKVVNGTIGNGGTTSFSTIMTQTAVSGSLSSVQSGFTFAAAPASISINTASLNLSFGSAQAILAPHTHPYNSNGPSSVTPGSLSRVYRVVGDAPTDGSSQSHTHPSVTTPHGHTITVPSHPHPSTETNHPHPVSSNQQDFSVYYRDIILATKD